MSRMHTGKKGKSGSHKPLVQSSPSWVNYKPAEASALIVKLGKTGMNSSMIGLVLRDTYGIPNIKLLLKKSVSQVLAENNIVPKIPEDLLNLINRAVLLRNHLVINKKDYHSKRGLQLIESKIKRLVKYYKNKGRLDPKWRYSPESAKLLIE